MNLDDNFHQRSNAKIKILKMQTGYEQNIKYMK